MVLSQGTFQGQHDKKFWFTASLLIKMVYFLELRKQFMYRHRDGHVLIQSAKLRQFFNIFLVLTIPFAISETST